ncbi:MAG: T9SS type A sorting domain-containing protein [Vicingaceae bacterium]
MKTVYYSLVIIIAFCFNAAAQTTAKDGKFEVVFQNKDLYFYNSPIVNLVSGYKDESILLACLNVTKNTTYSIYQSTDQGDTWNLLSEGKPDSLFSNVESIKQLSPNHISMVIEVFAMDSTNIWKRDYWVWSSNDLGKTWTKVFAGGIPLGFHFKDSLGVFSSTTNDTAMLWTTEDYGQSWKQRQLPGNMTNTAPARLGNKEFWFFDEKGDRFTVDSMYYIKNIDSGLWETKALHKNFGYTNFIAFNKNRILSAYPVWADIGNTALSYILETKNGGSYWSNPVYKWEDYGWARRGLYHNSYLDSSNMVFLGPNVLYSTNNSGNTWERAFWDDSISNGGTRGVYLFYNSKLDRRQLIFPESNSKIIRYTIPGAVGINESNSNSSLLKLFPNPVKNILAIEIDELEKRNYSVSIWSIDGRLVAESDYNSAKMYPLQIDVNHFNSGIYVVKVNTSNQSYCKRFVKH